MIHATLRRFCWSLLPVLAPLFVPGFLQYALSQDWMTPSYSTYTSYSTDGTYIYTSVTVSGSTSGNCPTQPAQLANECHNTHHTPQVYNVIGGVGGWETGGSVYWNSYLSMTNSQQIAATHGTEYTFSSSAQVMCTFLGTAIYSVSEIPTYLKLVVTTVKLVQDWGAGDCETTPDCLPGQNHLCNITVVEDGSPCKNGWDCDSLAYRFSQSDPYTCLPAFCTATTTLPGWCDQ